MFHVDALPYNYRSTWYITSLHISFQQCNRSAPQNPSAPLVPQLSPEYPSSVYVLTISATTKGIISVLQWTVIPTGLLYSSQLTEQKD
ncbi:hypothetical protein DPMN_075619 [Dreissena polymorpha]|uniref:Uncharacterized protein n=1 Tax=Dreissena polymorpha TaxID=45954 RepID=A0A9D3YH60_DREPO|nr:hypothetical protein DPMN_075619 [Dreissena polymorpha]